MFSLKIGELPVSKIPRVVSRYLIPFSGRSLFARRINLIAFFDLSNELVLIFREQHRNCNLITRRRRCAGLSVQVSANDIRWNDKNFNSRAASCRPILAQRP